MTTYQSPAQTDPAWKPIKKPAEVAEERLIGAILDGTFPINSHLPGERELSEQLGVTRPTLRETLQRLARDGWVEIQHGKSTRVRDYWCEGRLGVLNALSERPQQLPEKFIPDLLNVRLAMAPMYTALAVTNAPDQVLKQLKNRHTLAESPDRYAQFDWDLQHKMTLLSENAIFTLILNSFQTLFLNLAPLYFTPPEAREHSLAYYEALAEAARKRDPGAAGALTQTIMQESLYYWQQTRSS
jgi:GntR family negative regulator for fad regulon and positive regulator of fabA